MDCGGYSYIGDYVLKPYYSDSAVEIYLGDCRDILPSLPKVDLVLTDPPYGILSESGSAATRRSQKGTRGVMAWDVAPDLDFLNLIHSMAPSRMIWGGCHLQLGPTLGFLIWDKQIDGLNFGEVEFCWTTMKFAPRIFRYRAVGVDGGKVHPTQKPKELMQWCMGFNDGQNILDPFMGSGTTLRAAKDLGRKAIGIEIEEKYCEIAAKRMAQEVLI